MEVGKVVEILKSERTRLSNELVRVGAALYALTAINPGSKKPQHRVLSVAARARIAAAQRKRWAKFRKQKAA